jgi:S-adenosylmethionine hydrolase
LFNHRIIMNRPTIATQIFARAFLVFVFLLATGLRAQEPQPHADSAPAGHTVVFMTDFGLQDDSVAICKAVMLRIDPTLRIMDISHQVTPYSISDGARYLSATAPYYPPGTVFVAVIDPGVGSSRRAIVAKSKRGQYFVLPDNGLLTLIEERDGIAEAREITNSAWMIGEKLSSTFHGRDIFSPVGAHLARGDDWTGVGPVVSNLARLDLAAARIQNGVLEGEIIAVDGPFGNLITNIDAELLGKLGFSIGDTVTFEIPKKAYHMPFVRTFSDVPVGKPLLYIDSRGYLAIAINQRSAQAILRVKPPVPVFIWKK